MEKIRKIRKKQIKNGAIAYAFDKEFKSMLVVMNLKRAFPGLSVLSDRETAKKVRDFICKKINDDRVAKIVLNFDGIHDVSFRFTSDVIGELTIKYPYKVTEKIVIHNANYTVLQKLTDAYYQYRIFQ